MKVLFACGGTAGHINPAISVAESITGKFPDAEILFVGNPHGIEATLIPKAGYPFTPLQVTGFQRKMNLKNVGRNLKSVYLLAKSLPTAGKIIRSFKPDLVFGTGGYVSGPVLRKAHQMGIKTITHESNAYPGLTTKLLSKDVDRILIAAEGAKRYLKPECYDKIVVTGNPVRRGILEADRENARMRLGVGDRMCILSFGGSLGADRINESVAELMKQHYQTGKIMHIHAAGKENYEDFLSMLAIRDVQREGCNNIDVRPYINNMDVCLAAADLVVCRAGALTVSELIACGRASILIPSPNVAENHQYHNAMELVSKGAAELIEEKDLTSDLFCQKVFRLLDHPEALGKIEENIQNMQLGDAGDCILEEILTVLGE